MKALWAWLLILSALVAGEAFAADYEKFVGTFEGDVAISDDEQELKRDLSVTIKRIDDGFQVNWTTTTIKSDGKEKSKSYTIDFTPSQREHIYRSAMKKNLFGGREPLDPMKGDPYVWAHIDGETLIVNALIINELGGYEMQTYERTLVDDGMMLKFHRIRDGEALREIQAHLKRTDG